MRMLRGGTGAAAAGTLLIALSVGHFLLAGRAATRTIETNLPSSPAGAFRRTIEFVQPSPDPGRAYNVTLVGGGSEMSAAPSGARLRVQVFTQGRVRPILVRREQGNASRVRALAAWLRGDARLAIVRDRGWIDLGPAPRSGEALRVQLIGLLPGGFSFVMPSRPADGVLASVRAVRVDGEPRVVATSAPRYRIVVPEPAGPAESLARMLFFVGESRVLGGAAATGLLGLTLGWLGIRRWPRASICALVTGAVLLRAALLPPLQGADETSHVSTIEYLGCCGTSPRDPLADLPVPILRLADALDQNRVQHHRDEPMPVGGPDERQRTRQRLAAIAAEPTDAPHPPLPAGAALQPQASRAPAYYQTLAGLWPWIGDDPVLERVALYRILSALAAAGLWCLGTIALGGLAGSEQRLLLYACIPLLVPLLVEVMATTSNYGVAAGLGGLVGATAVAGVLAPSRGTRVATAVLVAVATLAGTRLWADDWLLAGVLVAVAALVAIGVAVRRLVGAWLAAAACVALALAIAAVAIAVFLRGERLGALAYLYLPEWDSAEGLWMIVLPSLPLLWVGAAAALGVAHRGEPLAVRRRRARRLTLAGFAVALVLFVATPFTTVPYETAWLELPELVRAYAAAFFSTNFALDQDTLSWKLYWGVFGWHDAFYPPIVYAMARWSLVGLFLCLPALSVRFAVERPYASAGLLLMSGIGVSLSLTSELLRQVNVVHPVGRYLMPWLTLAALPALVRLEAPGREPWLRLAVRLGVALEVWTAIAVVGARYAFGAG